MFACRRFENPTGARLILGFGEHRRSSLVASLSTLVNQLNLSKVTLVFADEVEGHDRNLAYFGQAPFTGHHRQQTSLVHALAVCLCAQHDLWQGAALGFPVWLGKHTCCNLALCLA